MPQYPKNELAQYVIATCAAFNVKHIVISPGSRNAPLIIGFTNHSGFKTYSIVDERTAAFFALGIAQQSKNPVALVCSSGSALLNYYPAIAEAFYSDIPLIVISADRPKHLIDIGDGQTIRQENVFENHVLVSANLEQGSKRNFNTISEVLKVCISEKGPVHLNVPFDEPLYEVVNKLVKVKEVEVVSEEIPLEVSELEKFASIWNSSEKKLVLVGACYPDELLQIQLNKIIKDESVIVLTETTSNLVHEQFINGIDRAIFSLNSDEMECLKPDILLTFGGMVVSKKIKQFLRNHKPRHHWHIDSKKAFDTFFSLTRHFEISPQLFFSQFFFLTEKTKSAYQRTWLELKRNRVEKHKEYINNCEFSDLKVLESVLNSIPKNSQVQLANSSIIRYSQLFDLDHSLKVFCNRGTSGIDGSTSTAIGASIKEKNRTIFITGDISFFYDSNALWNSSIRNDFRIIIINNDGGGIFKFIPGPKETNALPYFETPHGMNADNLASMYNFDYSKVSNLIELQNSLESFYDVSKQPKILEICTPSSRNDLVLKTYFKSLK